MGRSIRNKPKSTGGSGVSDAQLATKADASTVSALTTTVNTKASITDVSATSAGELTALTINDVDYTIPSGGGALNDLTDVSASGQSEGQLLKYNGTNWVPATEFQYGNEVLAGEDYGGTATISSDNLTVDRDEFSLTVTSAASLTLFGNTYNYTADGVCNDALGGGGSWGIGLQSNLVSSGTYNLTYDFQSPKVINHIKAWFGSDKLYAIGSFEIFGSQDNSTWTGVGSNTWTTSDYGDSPVTGGNLYYASQYRDRAASFDFNSGNIAYRYYEVRVSHLANNTSVSSQYLSIGEIGMYYKRLTSTMKVTDLNGGGGFPFFKFLNFYASTTIVYGNVFPLVTAAGNTDGAYSNSALGSKKYGYNVPVTNNRFQLEANTTWISHISFTVRGDPDVDLRVIETYIEYSETSTSTTASLLAGYFYDSHDDWTGYTEYTLYSGSCMFTVPSNATWLQIKQVAKTTTANYQVTWMGAGGTTKEDWGGIMFQRLK